MKAKTVVTITGIRPDFIRMKEVFRKLDSNFNHIMVHTGQHYDDSLSKMFFEDLKIRSPDYTLETGINSQTHYEQLSYLSTEIFKLFDRERIKPDLILFLGDSNSVLVSSVLFKEGYKIGHIEGGMRSYDRRMPEEVNRVICDYVSDFVFVYTPLYKQRLIEENKDPDSIFIVGNTITEIIKQHMPEGARNKDFVLADIHRSENLKTPDQYKHILTYLNEVGLELNLPVRLVKFNRAYKMIQEHSLLKGLEKIEVTGPYGFLDYLNLQYNAFGCISDSGTSQEECPLLGVPVVVPRLSTERPESVDNGNSILIGETGSVNVMKDKTVRFFKDYKVSSSDLEWLGDGTTSNKIIEILKKRL